MPYLNDSGSDAYYAESESGEEPKESANELNNDLESFSDESIESQRLTPDELSLSGSEESDAGIERLGAFLLKNGRKESRFSLPRTNNRRKSTWLVGDGFSGDEGNPGFGLFGIVKRKRRRSRSRSRADQPETEPTVHRKTRTNRLDFNHSTDKISKHRRGPPKDIWPTLQNFSEEIIAQGADRTIPDSRPTAPEAPADEPLIHHFNGSRVKPIIEDYSIFQYVPPQNKGAVDFENFRRVRAQEPTAAKRLVFPTMYCCRDGGSDRDPYIIPDSEDEENQFSGFPDEELNMENHQEEVLSRLLTSMENRGRSNTDNSPGCSSIRFPSSRSPTALSSATI